MPDTPPDPNASLPQAPERQAEQQPQVEAAQRVEKQKQKAMLIAQMEQWQGPLPPPAVLEKFNQIVPGSADRILKMAENEQRARINYDRDGLSATTAEARRGQYLGATISGVAIVGAVITGVMGAPAAIPVAFLSVPVLGIVRALIKPRNDQKD